MNLEPVSEYENASVGGKALCCESLFREHIEQAQALRDRQAAYLASLPTDPAEAIRAANKLLYPSGGQYPEDFEEALHLSFALEALLRTLEVDAPGRVRDATIHIAERVADAMSRFAEILDRVGDILGNPGRVERRDRV